MKERIPEVEVVNVETIVTAELGDCSYLAHDGSYAIVVDAQRDVDRVEAVLGRLGLDCVLVLETHVHNDYVTGGLDLAERTGARYVVAASEVVGFERRGVVDGEELAAGRLRIRVVATPGHTQTHVAYVVSERDGAPIVFTGGSLLNGGVGPTDLGDLARTAELTRAQYRSSPRLAEWVSDESLIYPTHRFRGAAISDRCSCAEASTIGWERSRNTALTAADEGGFVEGLAAGFGPVPGYYQHLEAINRRGPGPVDLAPPRTVGPGELSAGVDAGDWIVDLRDRHAYARGHLRGTIAISFGPRFSAHVAWLIPWGSPITLVATDADAIAAAQRQLVRLGIDRLDGAAVGLPGELAGRPPLRSYPVANFARLAEAGAVTVLDVGGGGERAGGHLPGSLHIPLDELVGRVGELPRKPLWVYCTDGYRASIAASLLDRAGHEVVLVDDDLANPELIGRGE